MEKVNLEKYDNIVILAPHPDDEVLGCSALFSDKNRPKLSICYVSDGCFYNYPTIRSKEAREIRFKELDRLCTKLNIPYTYFKIRDTHIEESYNEFCNGIREHCEKNKLYGKRVAWFMPNQDESHKDHVKTMQHFHHMKYFDIKAKDKAKWETYQYEIWTPMPKTRYYLEIDIDFKRDLLSYYPSQMEDVPYIEGLIGLNKYRGLQILNNHPIEAFW